MFIVCRVPPYTMQAWVCGHTQAENSAENNKALGLVTMDTAVRLLACQQSGKPSTHPNAQAVLPI